MNDKIINDLYEIRDHLNQVENYINRIRTIKNIFTTTFIQTRQHLYDIYNDRLDLSIQTKNYFDGHREVVKKMKKSDLKNIRLSVIDGERKSCSIFSSEDYNIILGIIFYDN
ncbi:hypothetical protein [Chryseobacterium cheonjiense]|uniref:Uncharacterized protein n=1 Tax=Chryseobacterium cheonjiense TaxID=2728845 RepID=A0A7Y0A502_9FLAO|nr:hypothetical protein [Chryseobacterium cheonjiense]NML56721.1 hypothetical protein [Chryseobacterium cheonjiense]